jgi:hypothetical protein
MGTIKRSSLCSYLYFKLAKMPCFSFLSFMFFSTTKLENRREEQVLQREGWHWWEGKGVRERGSRRNMVQIMYTHICKYKK